MREHYTVIIGILICGLRVSTGQLGRRTACGHCENARTWDDCFDEICGEDENCYINITQTANGKRVNAGCISQDDSLCKSSQNGFLLGSRAAVDNKTLCETCCHGDNCNVDYCKHLALKPVTSHTGIKQCHQCKQRGIFWQCSYSETCSPGQVCFAQELITTGFGNLPYYHGGCTDESRCDLVNIESFSNEHRFGEVGQGTCCYETNCNNASIFSITASKTTDAGTPGPTTIKTTTVKTTPSKTTPLQCMQCLNEGVGWNCDHVQLCAADELCFVQELDLTVDIPSLPNKYFHGGCSSKQRCSTVSTVSVRDESGLARVANGDCCSTDNCNKQILQYYKHPTTLSTTTTRQPTTTVVGVQRCIHCINEGVGWNCDNMQQCAADEVCFVQELEFAVAIPGIEKTYYHGGCINKVACSKVSQTSLYDEHGLAGVIRGECCYNNECNKNVLDVYKGLQTPERPLLTTPRASTTIGKTSPLQCMQCVNEGVGWNCDHVQQCTAEELCFVQELDLTVDIPSVPNKYFHGGCSSKQRCSTVSTVSVQDESGLARVTNGDCCSTDNCNKQLLEYYKHTTARPTATAATAVSKCMQCVNEGVGWNCGHTQSCSADEVCFIQELDLSLNIPSVPSKYFHGGCINKSGCSTISSVSVSDEHGLATVIKGQCCNSDNCNKQLWTQFQSRK